MEHYCEIHQCKFYENKKDGRVWYSHKIKGESGYCNEPKETEEPKDKPSEVKPKPVGQETGRCWNDIRELYIAGKLSELYGVENAINIVKVYREYLLKTLEIEYNQKTLPPFLKKNPIVEEARKMGLDPEVKP